MTARELLIFARPVEIQLWVLLLLYWSSRGIVGRLQYGSLIFVKAHQHLPRMPLIPRLRLYPPLAPGADAQV